ncbi:MAG: hypothetical protein ACI8WB_002650 [Phenylobacterium sp.]|jgi:hypothetical protein
MKIFPPACSTLLPVTLFIGLMPLPALAYFGPGGGLTAIGALLALIGVICYTFFGFIWFPLKRLWKKRKGGSDATKAEDADTAQKTQPDSDLK